MEPTKNKINDNIEQDKVDMSKKLIEAVLEQNTQIVINETNKISNEKYDKSKNESACNININQPQTEDVTKITESSEFSRSKNTKQKTNKDMEFEIDQIKTIQKKQSEKEDCKKTKDEINKKKEETTKNIANKKGEPYKDEANKGKLEINYHDKTINLNKRELNKDKEDFNKNVENSNISLEDSSDMDSNRGKTTKNNTDNILSIDNSNAKKLLQNKITEQVLECVDIDIVTESVKEIRNEKNEEIEKTEFIQISQDKEDTQLENQPEAEDPFGADNFNIRIDNVESMEVDSTNEKGLKLIEEQNNLKIKEKVYSKYNIFVL
jgi:hypothetical protein